ncbi:N-acetyltransferase GCN5 [Actinoplanes sp. SE50]|uniref:GNAT family N-acetyltransferase n=1 Tax=unclassified Actinoplanes TaxID=2626549 RepID=UPI00023EDD7A|nr:MULTISPECIES: GNAT family N-acetyltransferase [unclassified Actinoplanes]AEV88612.1 GCN5-related N-acetyltransferase [Actinoplanes sp. SE50/110]ATO87016.1 N-acetyltransferase GCN5 [Actinoplanes sp. SE50]SLM04434.1 N-acetyltransferase GCN5 [Actinoplanes sp. SE50/110]
MTALPDGWTTRRPTLDDVPLILELVHASDIAAVGEPDFSADEVRDELTGPHTDMSRDSWLAFDDAGRLAGWAYPRNPTGQARDFLEVYVWPGRGVPAQRPLLDLMMGRMAERAAELGHDPYTVRAGAIPTETEYIEALTAAGFTFLKQHARMRMSLDGIGAEAPRPPAGVTIRPVRHDDEAELRRFHAVIEEAFLDSDHPAMSFDDWRRQAATGGPVPYDEWFVAEADGELAGVLQSTEPEDRDEGWVRYLGVLRPYRKRGVGEALLRRAFAAYAGKGRSAAGLGVDMANPTEAARLYRKVGMTPLYRANVYQTTVPAARA